MRNFPHYITLLILKCSASLHRVVTSRISLYIPEQRNGPNEDISVTRQKEGRPLRSIPRSQITRTMDDFASIVEAGPRPDRLCL